MTNETTLLEDLPTCKFADFVITHIFITTLNTYRKTKL